MQQEKSNSQKVADAISLGKSLNNIAKGTSAGGVKGAALATVNELKRPIISIILMLFVLPLIFIISLPSIIFNGLNSQNALNSNYEVTSNIEKVSDKLTEIMLESYEELKEEVQEKASKKEHSKIVDNVKGQVECDKNLIFSYYSVSDNYSKISLDDFIELIEDNKDEFFEYDTHKETKKISEEETVTYTIYTISYVGEEYLSKKVFKLDEEQKQQAKELAENLAVFLADNTDYVQINNLHRKIAELIDKDTSVIESKRFGNPLKNIDWDSVITSRFGKRILKGNVNYHTGLDMGVVEGTEVLAIMSGSVIITNKGDTGYGNYIVINHGSGFVSIYAHLSEIMIEKGNYIEKGEVIAKSGNTGNSTGPHLHLEIIEKGLLVNPEEYLK